MKTARHRWTLLSVFFLAPVLLLSACQSDEEQLQGFMERGDAYKESEQFDEAIIEYKNALQIDPNYAEAHESLAETYLRTQRMREGYWELGETIRLDSGNVDARVNYASLALVMNQIDELVAQAEEVIQLEPENPKGHLLLGQAYATQGEYEKSEKFLKRAIELESDNSDYYAVLSSVYLAMEDPESAKGILEVGIERDPNPTLYTILGQILFNEDQLDEAEVALEGARVSAAEIIAQSEEPTATEYSELANAHKNLAAMYFQQEEDAKAIAIMEAGIEALPKNNGELLTLLAQYFREQGDPERADALLIRATEIDATSVEPYLIVSNERGRSGDLEGALDFAERAEAADPTSVTAKLRKAELLIDLANRDDNPAQLQEGRGIVTEILDADQSSPEGLFVLAKIQIAEGDLDSAIDSIRVALDGKAAWPQAHFILGSALFLKGDTRRARSELARAVELNPNLIQARRLLVAVHGGMGEYEYAIENGEIYLESNPEDDEIRILVAQSLVRVGQLDEAVALVEAIPVERRQVEGLFALGTLQAAQGKIVEARESLLAANELSPNSPRILDTLLEIDRAEGKLSYSIKRVNDAVEASPDDAALYRLQGKVGMLSGNQYAAEKALERAIELDPDDLTAYQYLAQLYAGTGRTEETISLYESATRNQPENAAAHHMLGMLYEMSGQREKAFDEYEASIENNPDSAESKNNLAYLMAQSDGSDLNRALELAQEAKAAMPDSANAADTLGWVLYKKGVPSAAVGYLREAAQVAKPDDPALNEIQIHLGLAYEASGNVPMAIETFEIVAQRANNEKLAGEARGHIERLKASG